MSSKRFQFIGRECTDQRWNVCIRPAEWVVYAGEVPYLSCLAHLSDTIEQIRAENGGTIYDDALQVWSLNEEDL